MSELGHPLPVLFLAALVQSSLRQPLAWVPEVVFPPGSGGGGAVTLLPRAREGSGPFPTGEAATPVMAKASIAVTWPRKGNPPGKV